MRHVLHSTVRNVLVHYCLFRTGGHVLDAVLEKNFCDALAILSASCAGGTLSNSELVEFVQCHPEISAVSSYHLRPPKPELDWLVVFDIFLLRDPLERLCSIFKYHSKTGGAGPLDRLARECDLGKFLEHLISSHPHLVNDTQVCYLAAGGRFYRPPSNSDLEKAVAVLEQSAVPATTSQLDVALVSAEYYLGPAFPNLDLSYVAPPQSSEAQAEVSAHELLKDRCSASTYAYILELTQLDSQLVHRVEVEILRRFEKIPDAGDRLRNFKARCASATEYFLEYDDVNA